MSLLSRAFIIDFLSCLFGCNKLRQKLGWWILLLESCTDAATAGENVWKVQFLKCQSGQFSCSVLLRAGFFFKLLFAMIFLQSWLVLKAVVTGLGHTVFFLFIGVKEVFMLHNSPICISSVYWPSALRILQPRPAAKPKIQYWYWMKEKKKTLTHTDAYIHTCVDIQYVNGPLMWQKLDTFKKTWAQKWIKMANKLSQILIHPVNDNYERNVWIETKVIVCRQKGDKKGSDNWLWSM